MAIVRYWVPVCPQGRGYANATALGAPGTYVGTCQNGQGQWTELSYVEPFDIAQLNKTDLANAFGAGFLVLGMGLVLAIPVRLIVKGVRNLF